VVTGFSTRTSVRLWAKVYPQEEPNSGIIFANAGGKNNIMEYIWICSSAQLTGTMMPGAKIAPKGSLVPGGTAPATIPT
jgi:hypothetical protein